MTRRSQIANQCEGQEFWAGLFSKEQQDRREADLAAAAAAQARRLEVQEDDDDDVDDLVRPRARHGSATGQSIAVTWPLRSACGWALRCRCIR